jgi:hypothetical protein
MSSPSKNFALIGLSFWLGCMIFFWAVVAPTLFNPDVASGMGREVAGAVVGALLRRIYLLTYITMGLATLALIIAGLQEGKGVRSIRMALISSIAILALNGINDRGIHPKIHRIKLEIANAEDSKAKILQERFDQWHKASTWIYGASMICGLIAAGSLIPTHSGSRPKRKSSR